MRYVLAIFTLAVLIACVLGGVFAATGLCVFVWGPGVMASALGKPKDWGHPASWVFLAVLLPAMSVGAVGAMFGVVFPLLSRYDIAGWSPDATQGGKLFRRYGRMMRRIARRLARKSAKPPQQGAGPGGGGRPG